MLSYIENILRHTSKVYIDPLIKNMSYLNRIERKYRLINVSHLLIKNGEPSNQIVTI